MSYLFYRHQTPRGALALKQDGGQDTQDTVRAQPAMVDGPAYGDAAPAALESIANSIATGGTPLQFSAAIDMAQSRYGNRATLEFANRQRVHHVARSGLRGASQAYPFLEQIQWSFGRHDISGLKGYTGAAARSANDTLGSRAYHKGGHVAFGVEPTLADAAHEAAHFVQGVSEERLEGGMGQAGDVYERHAERVAAAVVAGESAESLLDRKPGGVGTPATVRGDGPVQMAGGLLNRLGGLGQRSLASMGRRGSRGEAKVRTYPAAWPSGNRYRRDGAEQDGSSGASNYFPWGMGLGTGFGLAALAGAQYAKSRHRLKERENRYAKSYGPRFGPFRNVSEFREDVSMIQSWVDKQKAEDPEYALRLTYDQYKYGVIEAVIANSDPEIIKANIKRIEERYRGIEVMPGKATYYHYVVFDQHGQHRHMSHPSVEVTMGDMRVHGDLRGDSRRYKDTNKRVRPKIRPEDYGLDLGISPTDMTILEHPDTDFRAEYNGYERTIDIVKEIARFENIEMPEAFTALLLMEFWHLASIGAYDVHRTTCIPVSLDILAAGGADMEKISPRYAHGGRSILDAELMQEIDRFLAFNTEHHINQELLDRMRDPDATVISPKDKKERPLNIIGEKMPEFLSKYAGLEPWKRPRSDPWPWDRDFWDDAGKSR